MHNFLALSANQLYLLCILETPRQSPALRVKSPLCIRHGVNLHLHLSLRVECRVVVLVVFTMMELEHKRQAQPNAAGKNLSHSCATHFKQTFPHSLHCICNDSGILLPDHAWRTNGSRSASHADQNQREETQDASRPDSSKSNIRHSIHSTSSTTIFTAQKVKKEIPQTHHHSHAHASRPPPGTP